MGVHGLWKLLEPAGKMIPLESMAGKVLAIDVSIWLHQAIKGIRDSHGAPISVAHLLILFHRLCKLLFYKIKPVFVFDGGVPTLKKKTMSNRRKIRASAKNEAAKVRGKLFKNLMKHEVVRQMLSHGKSSEYLGLTSLALPGSSAEEELFKLPPLIENHAEEKSEEELSSEEGDIKFDDDIHTIDVTSSDFKNLPPDVRHEILLELIETRKQSSWKQIDKMPKESNNFSEFQMDRLLKRRAVQNCLDEAGKEMGGKVMTMRDLEGLLLNEPNTLENENFLPSKRIAQSENSRYLLLHNRDGMDEIKSEVKQEDFNIEEESITEYNKISVESTEEFAEPEETELTQNEIYDLILKEKEIACQKPTELTKTKKIKLSDDLIEIFDANGESCKDSSKVNDIFLNKNEDKSEKNLFAEDILSDKIVGPGNSDDLRVIDICEKEKKVESTIISMEVIEDDNGKNVLKPHSSSAVDEHISIETTDNSTSERSKQSEIKMCNTSCVSAMLHDSDVNDIAKITNIETKVEEENSIVSSNDSESDFVDVEEDIRECNSEKLIPNKNDSGAIEINITKGTFVTDDIFSDVFNIVPKQERAVVETEHIPTIVKDVKNDDANMIQSTTSKDLKNLQKSIESECDNLIQKQGKQERLAQNITEQMNLDAQELLRLFGVPYVVAPMEAEAQCAILDVIGLTDGTITDDSDIWLFGGRVVYKNFFSQKKHVEQFRLEDIEKLFKLSREDMIKIALLVGSDYTAGLEGIGPVTALEIIGAFPCSKNGEILSGLKYFSEWVKNGSDISLSRRSLRRKIKNTKIESGFPSEAVVEAYLHPMVDDSKEPFSWAKPNVSLIEKYTKIKFGWTEEKCNELLTPVIKKMYDKKITTLDKYFSPVLRDSEVATGLSKRVQNALKYIRAEDCSLPTAVNSEIQPSKVTGKSKSQRPSSTRLTSGEAKSSSMRVSKESMIPQKRALEQVLEYRKKSAIRIFKKQKKNRSQRKQIIAKEEVNLSENSDS